MIVRYLPNLDNRTSLLPYISSVPPLIYGVRTQQISMLQQCVCGQLCFRCRTLPVQRIRSGSLISLCFAYLRKVPCRASDLTDSSMNAQQHANQFLDHADVTARLVRMHSDAGNPALQQAAPADMPFMVMMRQSCKLARNKSSFTVRSRPSSARPCASPPPRHRTPPHAMLA